MSVTDEIKARLDIVNYIQQYVPLKKSGRNYKACCPFHAEKTPSFVVNPDNQSWRCFGACADGGDIFSFAMRHHGWEFVEALNTLGDLAGVEVRKRSPEQKQRDEHLDKLRGLLDSAAQIWHDHLLKGDTSEAEQARAYVFGKRGLTEETVRRFRVGYAPPGWQNMHDALRDIGYDEADILEAGVTTKNDKGNVYDRFRNRIIIPINDHRGRVVGFGGRVLDPDDIPKYLNSPQTPVFDKSQVLFGLDLGKDAIRKDDRAVIVEGYMDVIQAHQAGFMNVVAQMGTAMTDTQLKLLAPRYASKIIMALDADDAGQNATRRSLETARQTLVADYTGKLSIDIRVLQIPGAKDPDDLLREDPDRWQSLVDNAMPVADYVIQMETANLPDTATMQEREAAARRVLPMLVASENNLYKQDNIQKLALKLRIAERDLLQWSQENRPQAPPAPSREDVPPPLDYDELEPPPFDEDDFDAIFEDDALGILPPRVDESLETYCLRGLLGTPELLYQVNRTFRALAGEKQALMHGPLCDFGPEDFSRSEYRALVTVYMMAIDQHEMDVLDYMAAHLDAALQQHLKLLLMGESERVRVRVGNRRFSGDFITLWKKHERRHYSTSQEVEFLGNILKLRIERLNRARTELEFMQKDAQAEKDLSTAISLGGQIILSNEALRLLQKEIGILSARIL